MCYVQICGVCVFVCRCVSLSLCLSLCVSLPLFVCRCVCVFLFLLLMCVFVYVLTSVPLCVTVSIGFYPSCGSCARRHQKRSDSIQRSVQKLCGRHARLQLAGLLRRHVAAQQQSVSVSVALARESPESFASAVCAGWDPLISCVCFAFAGSVIKLSVVNRI